MMTLETTAVEKRKDAATWDETFMGIAQVVAKRSKDPRTQVGSCIVSSDHRILSVGYNGAPRGFHDDDFPWASRRECDEPLETKYPYVIHAERNAIRNFRGLLSEFTGATVYVTHFPCNECAKEISMVGIAELVFIEEYPNDLAPASKRILDAAGVRYRQLSLDENGKAL
jgi:dCMP deaminase